MRNLFKRFSSLTGRSLRTVGTCTDANVGECTIQYPGGSVVRLQGAGTEGTRYFVLDSRLDGEASSLKVVEIEV